MKQVAQRAKDGAITVVDAAVPALRPGWLLVANRFSLISAGTERSKVELGEKSLVAKARARPDLARKVVDRARTEGLRPAVAAARERLEALGPIGYSTAGIVREVGGAVPGVAPGDRVACAGGGWANHAELVAVPRNLVAKVPDGVELASAAYATVGAIALHAVRQSGATVGERVAVVGLGLVGQLVVRILVAAGCEAVGIDVEAAAVGLAERAGARAFQRQDPALEASVAEATDGLGVDAAVLCAATRSSDPLTLGARIARDRGRLVVVGEFPVEAERAILYEKELEIRLARSYGPGRYEREYEERGLDLPAGYVRWTEQRNLQAFVDLVATGRVDPSELTTHRFAVDDAPAAYALLTDADAQPRPFGVLLEYDERPARGRPRPAPAPRSAGAGIGVVGAGSFARRTILPALRDGGARLVAIASEGGLSATDAARRFGFERGALSPDELLDDDGVGAVVIATRHADHARLAAASLRRGKAVFVEKPLALSEAELAEIEDALTEDAILMVGFNRRFAPLVVRLRDELAGAPGVVLSARVNAGPLPPDHWLHDSEEGGGRLLGEGCHFVDLLSHLAGTPATAVHAFAAPQPQRPLERSDALVATLRFANGAVGTLVYSGDGDPRLPKERIEAFGAGLSAVLDDFRRLELFRGGKRTVVKHRPDKGHRSELDHFLAAVRGEASAIPPDSYVASTRATLALAESLKRGEAVTLC